MSFISISFAVLLLILLTAYHFIAYNFEKYERNATVFQNVLLLIASIVFYSFADLRFSPFLFYIIIITFLSESFCKNKTSLIIFLILDLLPLLFVKYIPHILRTQWIFRIRKLNLRLHNYTTI